MSEDNGNDKKRGGTKEFYELEAKYAEHLFGDIQCMHCKHDRGGRSCDAFPDWIPGDIVTGRHDHRKPYPGDHGILFEPKDEEEDEEK